MTLLKWLLPAGIAFAVLWILMLVFFFVARPKNIGAKDALRLLPDTLRLIRRLATDVAVPKGVRVRLWLLLAYLAFPIDIVPDFIPVIGHADDVIIVALVLRGVVRRAGFVALERNWPGSRESLGVLTRLAGVPS